MEASGAVPFAGLAESETVSVGKGHEFSVQVRLLHAAGQLPFAGPWSQVSLGGSTMPFPHTAGGAETFTVTESDAEPPGPVHESVYM
jgi:hypothetical protein